MLDVVGRIKPDIVAAEDVHLSGLGMLPLADYLERAAAIDDQASISLYRLKTGRHLYPILLKIGLRPAIHKANQ